MNDKHARRRASGGANEKDVRKRASGTAAKREAPERVVAELTITSLGAQGDGVAATEAGYVYVPFALPGERVMAEIEGERARVVEILTASPARVEPICPHSGVCGGCALQHLAAEEYLAWKRQAVVDALGHRGIETPVEAVRTVPLASRRRAVFSAAKQAGAVSLGFHRALSHDIVDLKVCPVVVPAITSALPDLRALLGALLPQGGSARVTVTATDTGLDVLVARERSSKAKGARLTVGMSATLAAHTARLTVDGEELFSIARPSLHIGGFAVVPPPGAFLQSVAAAETMMAELVCEGVGRAKNVADLYAGMGTFSLPLAAKAKVTAVEFDAALLNALAAAARGAKGLKPITALQRDLEHEPLSMLELARFDAAVFDPPRAGAAAQAQEFARSRLARVVAVSCNAATFARDARTLTGAGFRLERVVPVDQFVFSPHIELVAWFGR